MLEHVAFLAVGLLTHGSIYAMGNFTICDVPGPICNMKNLQIDEICCDCYGLDYSEFHEVTMKCRDILPGNTNIQGSAANCLFMVASYMVHLPDYGWSDCPICEIHGGNCSIPLEYPGASMMYTGTSCGSIARYQCHSNEGIFGGFDVDTCIRYFNQTAQRFEMRWHSEINGRQDTQGCVSTCPIDTISQKIYCGETNFPTKNVHANMGQRIKWKPASGFKLDGSDYTECLPNGTWSHPVPCCYRHLDACRKLAVEHAAIKYEDCSSGGVYRLTVQCHPGYTLYGQKNFNCSAGLMSPAGTWPPSCVPTNSNLPCLPPPDIANGKVLRVAYNDLRVIQVTKITYTCELGFIIAGSPTYQCYKFGLKVVKGTLPKC